ncbi:ROK family protein [Micromonospora echinofusca]|uniref:ROK family transcriptional regulator n=1 Tax=Micromonospora echinofusca TaxID=47858 RepID=UPI0034479123
MELARATNRGVRMRNRSALLSKVFLDGPLTRQDLVRGTGLSQPAVSNVVGDLIDEGLVVEAGAVGSDGGRPGMMLRVAPRFAFVVGETRVRVELFDFAMTPLAGVAYPLASRRTDPAEVAGHVLAGIGAVTARAGVAADEVLGVGAGRGVRHAVFALVGSGVGAAVVTDGVTYRGASSSAGEWGHTTSRWTGGSPGGRSLPVDDRRRGGRDGRVAVTRAGAAGMGHITSLDKTLQVLQDRL